MSDAHDSVRGPDEAAVRTLVAAYRVRFGTGETPHVFFSPGRVNLMGAHLDYNGGPVMPTAIDRGTFLALGRRTDGRLRLASSWPRPGPWDSRSRACSGTRTARAVAQLDQPVAPRPVAGDGALERDVAVAQLGAGAEQVVEAFELDEATDRQDA